MRGRLPRVLAPACIPEHDELRLSDRLLGHQISICVVGRTALLVEFASKP
jgi:hypothetical protein